MLFRVLLATLLLGASVFANLRDGGLSNPAYISTAAVIVATYGASIAYARWLRRAHHYDVLVPIQLVGDAVLAGALVMMTEGVDSAFTFLYFLAIFSGAILRGRSGAIFSASASALTYIFVFVLQYGGRAPHALFGEAAPIERVIPVASVLIHILAFYAVAFLAGYLAEKVGQVGSELERRQLDIRQLRALNENIVRSLSTGLVTLDLQGRISFFNPAAESITGLSYDSVSMRSLGDVLPEFAELIVTATRDSTLPEGRIEGRLTRRDGVALIVGLSVSVLRDSRGLPDGHVLSFQDLTAVRAMEAEIQRRDHLAAIGKLSAAIAHEIRNPLASISGCVEMLGRAGDRGAEDKALMGIVVREVDRLNVLITDFLDYARPIQIARRRTNARDLVEDVIHTAQMDPSLASRARISVVHHESQPLDVDVDPQRIQQVLLNVIRNACQASPTGGEVHVTTASVKVGIKRAVYAAVQIDDTGPGLTEEVRARMFEPFFTTKVGGTGLGLATSHRIVVEHGGMLLPDNAPGGGARFVVLLPLARWTSQDHDVVPELQAPLVHRSTYVVSNDFDDTFSPQPQPNP
jgi:two-component system sensor histidine kinase PilS (NtrC family)